MKFLIVMSTLFVFGTCSNSCYDCNPAGEHKCLSPEQNNIKTTSCQDFYERKLSIPQYAANQKLEYQCYTLIATSNNNKSDVGIYRGCAISTTDSCKWLEDEFLSYSISKCISCSSDDCNIEDLEDETRDSDNSGVATISLFLGVLLFSFGIIFEM